MKKVNALCIMNPQNKLLKKAMKISC